MKGKEVRFQIAARDRTKGAFASVRKSLGRMNSALGGMGGLLAGAFAVGGIIKFATATLDAGDKIHKMSIRLGETAENLSQLKRVAELGGVSFENLNKGLTKLQKSAADAGAGLSTPKKAFERLNIDVEKFKKLGSADQFKMLADALQLVENPANRTQLAMDLMGRSGADLISVMQGGGTAITKAMESAAKAGETITGPMAEKMAAANDGIRNLQAAFQSVGTELTVAFAPAIARIAQLLADKLPAAIDQVRAGFQAIGQFIQPVIGWFQSLNPEVQIAGEKFIEWFGENGFVITGLTIFGRILTGMLLAAGPIGLFIAAASLAVAAFQNWDQIVAFAENVYNGIKLWLMDNFVAITDGIGEKTNAVIGFFQNMRDQIVGFVRDIYNGVKTWLLDKFTGMVNAIGEKVDAVTGFFRDMWDKVVGNSYVPDMVNAIGEQFGKLQTLMVDPANRAAGKVKNTFENLQSEVKNSLSSMAQGLLGNLGGNGIGGQLLRGVGGKLLNFGLDTLFSSFPGFATGGDFTVGGSGGTDSKMVAFRATPGEQVSIRTPGQQTSGSGGKSGVVVNQTLNITTGVQQTVRAELMQMMPQIIAATTSGVEDARRRGGNFAQAFS